MKHFDSLDELIARKAVEFADQMKAVAAMADKEEEIRIEAEIQLAFIQKEAGIKLESKHEFTVASGRVDSVYSRVIIEYKNPKSPGDRIGPKAESPGSKKVVEQIKKRFYDMRNEHRQPLNSLFGVGLDGNYFIFIRFRDDKWQVQEPVEVNKVSAERFLWALFNLGSKGKAFLPEYLAGDFGSEGGNTIAIAGIRALYDAIVSTDNPKAQTFFSQWKILFGEVCGYDVDIPSDKIKKLAEFYQVGVKDPKPAELLFAVHTYYALFMKLLAAEIVAFFHKLPTPLQKMMVATTSNKLKREMEDLEAGSIFRHLNITNFLEGDLFAWYIGVWTPPIEKLVREMVTRLDDYNPGTLSEDPTGSRDLLKKLYQQLFPKSVRHDLGEYYTPDWLAEHVLDDLGYAGDPDKRLLDPACGSGTFLVIAINRIRLWYDKNREGCRFDEGDLCHKILANVIGFDLNPLAIMAARTNYLIAIRDLIGRVDKVEIPIYLCDSVMTPSEYGGLFAGGLGKTKALKTAPATFIIPTEIATNREDVAKYAEQLESCIRNGYLAEEFIQRCRDEGLPISEYSLHTGLYRELVKLDKANKNGVWARIIKNAFAPLFVGRVDYIAGNPPWVNYENLPADYREATAAVWEKYQLFPKGGWRARFAKGNTELAMVFTYAALDNFLKPEGKLGFVVTQSVFQSKDAGKNFRRFIFSDGRRILVGPVNDFTALQPFEGATNRTASFVAKFAEDGTTFPVQYILWNLKAGSKIESGDSVKQIRNETIRINKQAFPLAEIGSPWMILPSGIEKSTIDRVQQGKQAYRAWKGSDTRGGNGIFWLEVIQCERELLLARNTPEFSKKKPPEKKWGFEPDLIYPLLKGKETERWTTRPHYAILFPHHGDSPIPENELKRTWPKTYAYFKEMESYLKKRKMFDLSRRELVFYSLFETGDFLMAPYKVVWKYIARELTCAVQEPLVNPYVSHNIVIPDHKLVIVPFDDKSEAHYVCAVLNSSIARFVAGTYIVGTQISTHVLEYIKVPKFDDRNVAHKELSQLSLRCHEDTAGGNLDNLSELEGQIDRIVAKLWGISADKLSAIQSVLNDRHHHGIDQYPDGKKEVLEDNDE
jgi:hypothetical protein